MKLSRKTLLAVVVVLLLIAAYYWYWVARDTVKLTPTELTVAASGGVISFKHAYSGKSDPATWAGKKVTIHTKSLGKIKTTVGTATASSLATAANAYTGSTPYVASVGDYARITLKY
jgi:hypothetical protein